MAQFPPTILVIGDFLTDIYIKGNSISVSRETPSLVVSNTNMSRRAGGAGNAAYNLLGLGCSVILVGVCKDDSYLDLLRTVANNTRIKDLMIRVPSRQDIEKVRIFHEDQQLLRYDTGDTIDIPDEIQTKLLTEVSKIAPRVDAIILSDYGGGILTKTICRKTILLARRDKKLILCDPRGRNYTKYTHATGITPNEDEAMKASGIEIRDDASLEDCGRKLLKEGFHDFVLITRGKRGMALFEREKTTVIIPSISRKLKDTIGAGDTVIATVTYGLTTGLNIKDSCNLANRAAGIVVGKTGTATTSIEEIERHYNPSKIAEAGKLQEIADNLRQQGKRIVFTCGCFDIFHASHARFLSLSAQQGDVLIVGLNSDKSVKKIKGPAFNLQEDRAAVLASIECVDYIVIFDKSAPKELIKLLKPDIFTKGSDYIGRSIPEREAVEQCGGKVVVIEETGDLHSKDMRRKV